MGVRALLGTTAAVALAAGCGTDGGTSSATSSSEAPSATSPSAASSSPTPTASSPSASTGSVRDDPPFGTKPVRRAADSGSDLVLVDVRVREAEGFDRIVLELSGTGTPGWVVRYTDEAVLDGSGDVVDVGEGAVLDIYASGTTWPAPDYYSGPAALTPRGGTVEKVFVGGTFEGTTQVLAGIDGGRAPFRVLARTSPSRLVVDVQHPTGG